MATYLAIVEQLLLFTEKITLAEATNAQQNLALRDVCDAVRYVYNHGDLSFKTVIKRSFPYVVQTDLSLPGRGTPLPADFMGFHQTGKVFLQDFPTRQKLEYLPYHKIMELTEGPLASRRDIPTHYGLGGPSDPDSVLTQREILLWPTPTGSITIAGDPDPVTVQGILLKLIYQRIPPADILDIGDADVEIPRIPATWHIPVILAMAKVFRTMDKGADESALSKTLATAIKQMNTQEPHGRERARHRPIHPAWQ